MRLIFRVMSNKSLKRKSLNKPKEDANKKAKTDSKPKTGHWALGLLSAMNDPDLQVFEDNEVAVIKDKYPKAQVHYLVLPKQDIPSLKSVTKEHVQLLKHMDGVAAQIVKEKHANKKFKFGYHSQASMSRLHLHVISDDMKSDCLKTKKHWNSFNSKFFLDSKKVREELENLGKISLPSAEECKNLINTPLKCHKCDYLPSSLPDLKKHINVKH